MGAGAPAASGADRGTLIAFAAIVLIGGMNAVGIKYSNAELAPFWGAALRFGLAALILGAIVVYRRLPAPRGKALVGSVLYGLLNFGVSYAAAYWGLQTAPAAMAMIVLALVPLLTLFLAVLHGLERFRAKGALGAIVALAGIAIIFGDGLSADPALLLPIIAFFIGALAIAETNVIVKLLPRSHPVVNNSLAMAVGAALLLVISLVAGEPMALPSQPVAIAAVAYLVLVGSIALFMLFLYVIERWTASSTSYTLLIMPLVTLVGGAALLGEEIRPIAVVGGALVLLGVYVGAFNPSLRWPLPGLLRRRPAVATEPAAPTLENPCT
jgi:drug/metabolite transporter (DMT)-like permease